MPQIRTCALCELSLWEDFLFLLMRIIWIDIIWATRILYPQWLQYFKLCLSSALSASEKNSCLVLSQKSLQEKNTPIMDRLTFEEYIELEIQSQYDQSNEKILFMFRRPILNKYTYLNACHEEKNARSVATCNGCHN